MLHFCQSNLALAFPTFCHILNYTTADPERHEIFLSSAYTQEKVYSRDFLLPICGFHSHWKTSFGRSSVSQRSSTLPHIHLPLSRPQCHIRWCFALEHTATVIIPPLIDQSRFLLYIQKPHSANSSLESLNQLIEAPVKCTLFDSCSVCNEWFCPQNLSKELSRNLFLAQCYAITKKIHIHIQHIYASRHTSICYQKDIDVLEQVQRKTVKLMKGIEDRFGEEKLKELRLFALQVKKG